MPAVNHQPNVRYTAGFFKRERDVLAAVREARRAGLQVHDVYTPFAVHGMDGAMGLRRSRLTWIAFVAGVMGLAAGLTLQIWTSVYDWPLNVGGAPFNSFPLFIPVTFELTVLFSGLIAIGMLLIRNRLWLFSKRRVFDRVTDDLFVCVIKQSDAASDVEEAVKVFAKHGAIRVTEGDQFV